MDNPPIREVLQVLIVEDERFSRTMLARFITKRFPFCEVREAENGLEALKLVDQNPPHAIFLDLRMPIMNGIEMMEKLRSDPVHSEIPIIITTAIKEVSIVKHLTQLGIEDYLLKPIDVDNAYIRIGKILMTIHNPKAAATLTDVCPVAASEKHHKILLVDDDPTFRMFFASMIGSRCEVLLAKDGNEACRLAQESDLITEICISENLPEGIALQNPKFLAKKLHEIRGDLPVEILLCSDRAELRGDEKKIFQGIILRTFVQKLFIESLIKKIFKDDSKSGSVRHLVVSQFAEKIRAILITEIPSFIRENVSILDRKDSIFISDEHSESIFVYISEGKLDIAIGIVGLLQHFEQLGRIRGDVAYRTNGKANQIFQGTLKAITAVFVDILREFNYTAKINSEAWKKKKTEGNQSPIYSIPFRFASGEEFVCSVWFNDVS